MILVVQRSRIPSSIFTREFPENDTRPERSTTTNVSIPVQVADRFACGVQPGYWLFLLVHHSRIWTDSHARTCPANNGRPDLDAIERRAGNGLQALGFKESSIGTRGNIIVISFHRAQ